MSKTLKALSHAYERLNQIPHNYRDTNFTLIEEAIKELAKAENKKKHHSKGLCQCLAQPMGACGLEGYVKGEQYFFEYLIEGATDKKPYFRLYPAKDLSNYYETCSRSTFDYYFKILSEMEATE